VRSASSSRRKEELARRRAEEEAAEESEVQPKVSNKVDMVAALLYTVSVLPLAKHLVVSCTVTLHCYRHGSCSCSELLN
jgi:hypothetical protein